ncbi:MAG: hypothetical protein AAB298_06210, partial [Pseudomonadota bacterium]
MSAASDDDWSPDDAVLGRADALLNKHRRAGARPAADPNAVPTLTEAVGGDPAAQAIPTLTDSIAAPIAAGRPAAADAPAATPEPVAPEPVAPESVEPPPDSAPEADATAGNTDYGLTAPVQNGEVISRVQTQNLEHGVYQKLRQGLDAQIESVLEQRFMPEVATALDRALQTISSDLKTHIDTAVRASIEAALKNRLPAPREDAGSRPDAPEDAVAESGIMR